MKFTSRAFAALCLAFTLVALALPPPAAFGQGKSPPPAGSKIRVQGYTRTNKHTGQSEQVKSHKRRPPPPLPVQVQPYTRSGKPVAGHERQPPAKPSENGSISNKKAQGVTPPRLILRRWGA